jgi:L-2-hydroxyglutarate oxidase LhgO
VGQHTRSRARAHRQARGRARRARGRMALPSCTPTRRRRGRPGSVVRRRRGARRAPALPPMRAALLCERTGIVDAARADARCAPTRSATARPSCCRRRCRQWTRLRPGCASRRRAASSRSSALVNAAGLDSDRVAALSACRPAADLPVSRRLLSPARARPLHAAGVPGAAARESVPRRAPDARAGRRAAARARRGVRGDRRDDFGTGTSTSTRRSSRRRGPCSGRWRRRSCATTAAGSARSCGRRGADERDFVVREGPPGCVHLIGIESPGLTAALALAERVAARCC